MNYFESLLASSPVAHWVMSATSDYRESVAQAVRGHMSERERKRMDAELIKDYVLWNGYLLHKDVVKQLQGRRGKSYYEQLAKTGSAWVGQDITHVWLDEGK